MKTLKFTPELRRQITSGVKTTTWRLFDDKNLTEGDQLEFIQQHTLESFGTGQITQLTIKTLGTLEAADWEGHERYASDEEMYATYRTYYTDPVGPETVVKIIHFRFQPK